MEPVRIKEHNPLNLVECGLDVVFAADDCEREVGKAISLDQGEIAKAITAAFDQKFINH